MASDAPLPVPDERAEPAQVPASPELEREVTVLPDGRRLTLYAHRLAARPAADW